MTSPEERYARQINRAIGKLSGKLDLSFSTNPFRTLTKRFVIACSARTGSHLLCQKLLGYGAVAMECFGAAEIIAACRERGLPGLESYCQQHLERNTPGRIFGVKGWSDILAPMVLAGELPQHLGDWRFVHLTRADTLKQAISFVIAEQTQAWRSFKAPVKRLNDSDFDAERISRAVAGFVSRNKEWENFFQLFAQRPLRVTYEELAADPAGVTSATAAFLGLSGPPIETKRFVTPPLEVQSSELNVRWEKRFLRSG